VFRTSTGDEPGSAGGVLSGTNLGKAQFVNYSFDVIVEGRNVPRLADLMIQNELATANTAPFPEMQPNFETHAAGVETADNEIVKVEIL
jgi:hypothetical protein